MDRYYWVLVEGFSLSYHNKESIFRTMDPYYGKLGRPLEYFIFSLIALFTNIFSEAFKGQPSKFKEASGGPLLLRRFLRAPRRLQRHFHRLRSGRGRGTHSSQLLRIFIGFKGYHKGSFKGLYKGLEFPKIRGYFRGSFKGVLKGIYKGSIMGGVLY